MVGERLGKKIFFQKSEEICRSNPWLSTWCYSCTSGDVNGPRCGQRTHFISGLFCVRICPMCIVYQGIQKDCGSTQQFQSRVCFVRGEQTKIMVKAVTYLTTIIGRGGRPNKQDQTLQYLLIPLGWLFGIALFSCSVLRSEFQLHCLF